MVGQDLRDFEIMKIMTKTVFTVGLLALLMSLPVFGASVNKSIRIEAGSESSGATSVNGSISVGENAVVTGGVKTVNGAIRVAAGASIGTASTVNGSVGISDNVRSLSLKTVNGSIKVGKTAAVDGKITTVNGSITVGDGSSVVQGISNVNGQIEISGAEVGGDVATVNGDVYVVEGAVIKGDLRVEKPSSRSKLLSRKPRLVIGPGSSVEGVIDLQREVELFISDTATVGGVTGEMTLDDAVRFSGKRP